MPSMYFMRRVATAIDLLKPAKMAEIRFLTLCQSSQAMRPCLFGQLATIEATDTNVLTAPIAYLAQAVGKCVDFNEKHIRC